MRCKACDKELKQYELDNAGAVTGELTGLCNYCQAMSEDDSHDTDQINFEGTEFEGTCGTGTCEPDRDVEFDGDGDNSGFEWPHYQMSQMLH